MKASGISFSLSPVKIEHDDEHYLEFYKPDIVQPGQTGFSVNTEKDGFGGPSLYLFIRRKEPAVILVEANLWVPGTADKNNGAHLFHIALGSNDQTLKIPVQAGVFQSKKMIFTLVLDKGLNKIRIYDTVTFWNLINCQITYLN